MAGSGHITGGLLLLTLLLAGCTGSTRSDGPQALAQDTSGDSGQQTPADPNAPAPSVTFGASAAEIAQGGSITLNWSASDADDCTASGGWSGNRSTSGSESIGPLGNGTTFSLSCSGPGRIGA